MIEFDEARDAAVALSEYATMHKFRTRRWSAVFVGITEQLTDNPIAEFVDTYSVVIESKKHSNLSNRDRRIGYSVLEVAGINHVPVKLSPHSDGMLRVGYSSEL